MEVKEVFVKRVNIKEIVKNNYAKIAQQESSCCAEGRYLPAERA